jgi:hypothetical protein
MKECPFFGEGSERSLEMKFGKHTYNVMATRKVPTTKLLSPLSDDCIIEKMKGVIYQAGGKPVELRSFCHRCRQDVTVRADEQLITPWREL